MNYTEAEIARAKGLFARAMRKGKPRRMAVAAMAGISRPRRMTQLTHERTWRDYLPQARREFEQEPSG